MTAQDDAPERWLPIPGWDGLYEISSRGRVRGLDRIDRLSRRVRGRILDYGPRPTGETRVHLRKDGQMVRAYVSQLVALAFHGEGEPGQRAMHVDTDRGNDCAQNLEWAAPSAIARKRKSPPKTAKGAFRPVPVVATCLTSGEVRRFESQAEAVRAGFSQACISACLRGINKSHGGFRWERAADPETRGDSIGAYFGWRSIALHWNPTP